MSQSQKSLREALEDSFDTEEENEEELESSEEESEADLEGEGEPSDDDDSLDSETEDGDEDEEPVPPKTDESRDEVEGTEEKEDKSEDKIPAPVSWKPAARELWNKIPKDIQLEVQRREAEISRGLQQASGHKKIAQEYVDIVKPFEQLMRANGHTPRESISGLLQSAAGLQVGSPAQKVQIVTDIIKNYGIDLQMLDSHLAGEELPDNEYAPIISQFQQELAPIKDFMGQFQQTQQRTTQEATQAMYNELEAFTADPRNEFFEDVREDMADIMELASKRGREMTLEQAYKKACNEHPEISKVLKQRAAAARANRVPRTSDHSSGRKRHAASSVRSSPPSSDGKTKGGGSLRDTISAAFESSEDDTI